MEIVLLSGFILCIGIVGMLVRSNAAKIDELEDLADELNTLKTNMVVLYDTMVQIDTSGAFASDDEVGDVFKQLKSAIDKFVVDQGL